MMDDMLMMRPAHRPSSATRYMIYFVRMTGDRMLRRTNASISVLCMVARSTSGDPDARHADWLLPQHGGLHRLRRCDWTLSAAARKAGCHRRCERTGGRIVRRL